MEIAGEYRIPASKQRVWEALNDPEILKAAIPGCESIEKQSDTELAASVKIKMGPVRATFKGKVTLSDLDPPNGYTISGEGQGGVAGFGRGSARVTLADVEGDTLLTYTANAEIGGKLAQIGSRLVESATRKLSKDFFEGFSEAVVASAGGDADAIEATPQEETTSAEPATDTPVSAPARGMKTAEWTAGLVAIVLLILLLINMFV